MLFRPSESSKKITDFYRRYLLTTFSTNNEEYNRQLKEALEKDGAIANGPYISMSDPYKKGKTLRELADEGIVSPEILNIKKFYVDRPLYMHQEIAIRKAMDDKNLIITTGTGSGKTESFLIPIINQLLIEKEKGTLGSGVRALIIYPMNALVNDQIRRLRELLSDMDGDSKITYGRFTGETEDTYEQALRKYKEMEDINHLNENEIISREQMRLNPPNILITNYAMLEYMLLRPGDNIIFGKNYADKWKYIVFDEAHSYSGAKGIEVSALIRRVKAMLNRDDIKFILTSATLGDKNSDKDIVSFAESLCTAKFDLDSIVKSCTHEIKTNHKINKINFEVYRQLAVLIRENASDEEIISCISNYDIKIDTSVSVSEILYNMILHDDFYYKVRSVLLGQIKTLDEIAYELEMSVEDFTDFIAVASNALYGGDRLFEAKYHMFLRGIEGVYVTLAPSNKLFINKMETYKPESEDKNDIGFKVFTISFCSNCNALYITGQENEGYLQQKSKFNDDYNPDVFLLSGDYDIDDDENENVFQICSKCGAIKRYSSVKGLQCGHGSENINKLIRVKKSGEVLHSCPCCHSVNGQRSILRPYYLGSEAATAVIATALYNELPGEVHHITKEIIDDPFFGDTISEKDEVQILSKQFLTFSDNRQTAAFFASYLDNTYRDSLIKRIMHYIMEEHEDEFEIGISVTDFVNMLVVEFEKINLFPEKSEEDIQKTAWIYTLREMSNYKAKNSMLKKGNIIFDVDISIGQKLKGIELSADEVTNMFKVMLRCFMRDAAIKTPFDKKFTPADVREFTFSGMKMGYDRTSSGILNVVGWCPESGKTNKRLKYLTKVLDNDEITARKLLNSMWNYIERDYLQKVPLGKRFGYALNIDKVRVKTIHKLYRCSECKEITPYNVKGICENPKCNGYLVENVEDTLLTENHYYNLYTKLNITPMNVKEHTAQLSSEKAYEYQRQFKDKKINVLSCSTTFEMGVDVGSLETVFMRNMPPSPANYAQRAGRAGRSINSAAYSITFCPNSSHDLNYFKNPVAMIKGTIKPPLFNVSNEKIVLRHIFASAFSHFWRTYPELYKTTIGEFIEIDGFSKMKEYLYSYPDKLRDYLLQVVPKDIQETYGINSFSWITYMFGENDENPGLCDIVLDKYNEEVTELNNAKFEYVGDDNKSYIVATIMKSIKTIKNQRLIEFLSKNNLIPKYGFPVDTVELKGKSFEGNQDLRLNRDLFNAISEYAPESELVADGNLLKSRYVRKLSGYEWPKYNYAVCKNCLSLNKNVYVNSIKTCKQCGEKLIGRNRKYIIPKFGFLLDNEGPKPVGNNKPERTYKGSISYIGDENKVEFNEYYVCNNRILVGNSKMDSLAVLNESPFFICETCGYGRVDEKTSDWSMEFKHKNSSGYDCLNNRLNKYSLGHEFQTDVVLLKFVDFDISKQDEAWTILYSMLEGFSRYLSIDRNELSGCLTWYKDISKELGNFAFVLFDNTPGGAGYVRQLTKPDILVNMLKEGFKVVNDCICGGELADTACYSCLCNYYNQKQHDILKRKYAIDFYQQFSLSPNDVWNVWRNGDDLGGVEMI